jgi:hypothetical protein
MVDSVNGTLDVTLDNGAWLSLADAARALGISEKTARRRAKADPTHARQVPTPHGPAWQMWVPTRVDARVDTQVRVDNTVPTGTQAPTGAQPADVAALVALVDRLTTENRELVGAVAAWQSQAVVLAGRLMDAEQRLALTGSSSPVDASGAPERVQAAPEPPEAAQKSPWWRRWRSWLAAGLVVTVVGTASCQASGSTKHAELCAEARASMDGRSKPRGPGVSVGERFWSETNRVVDIVSKTC